MEHHAVGIFARRAILIKGLGLSRLVRKSASISSVAIFFIWNRSRLIMSKTLWYLTSTCSLLEKLLANTSVDQFIAPLLSWDTIVGPYRQYSSSRTYRSQTIVLQLSDRATYSSSVEHIKTHFYRKRAAYTTALPYRISIPFMLHLFSCASPSHLASTLALKWTSSLPLRKHPEMFVHHKYFSATPFLSHEHP